MAEPQPTPPPPHGDADVEEPPPTNAEDRKAAAALSSLVARDEDDGKLNGKAANHVDQEALGRAISRLEMSSAGGKGVAGKEGDGKGKGKGKEEVAKKVKVDQVDVGLLVSLFLGYRWVEFGRRKKRMGGWKGLGVNGGWEWGLR